MDNNKIKYYCERKKTQYSQFTINLIHVPLIYVDCLNYNTIDVMKIQFLLCDF